MKRIIMCISMGMLFALSFFYSQPTAVHAQGDITGTQYAQSAGLSKVDPRTSIAYIVGVVISLMGMGALCLFIYAGYMWMTSMGNEEQIKKAKKTILTTMLGLAIILSAYAITSFVYRTFYRTTTGYIIYDS